MMVLMSHWTGYESGVTKCDYGGFKPRKPCYMRNWKKSEIIKKSTQNLYFKQNFNLFTLKIYLGNLN